MLIEWEKEKHSVGVEEMDLQHQKLINIINDLFDVVNERDQNVDIDDILDALSEYAKVHFTTEEGYFDKFNYERSDIHKDYHDKFETKIISFVERYKKEKDLKFAFGLLDFLEDWFIYHVTHEDKKYTKCFNEHGLF